MFLQGKTGVDTIKDFNLQEGDVIDIADILADEFDPVSDLIEQFVKIEYQGKDAVLSVDKDLINTPINCCQLYISSPSECGLIIVSKP